MNDDTERELMLAMDEAEREVMASVSEAVAETVGRLADASPVLTGRYEAEHHVVLNDADVPQLITDEAQRGARQLGVFRLAAGTLRERARAALRGARLGEEIRIANPTPYAGILETRGSTNNPGGNFYENAADDLRAALDPSA